MELKPLKRKGVVTFSLIVFDRRATALKVFQFCKLINLNKQQALHHIRSWLLPLNCLMGSLTHEATICTVKWSCWNQMVETHQLSMLYDLFERCTFNSQKGTVLFLIILGVLVRIHKFSTIQTRQTQIVQIHTVAFRNCVKNQYVSSFVVLSSLLVAKVRLLVLFGYNAPGLCSHFRIIKP